MEVNFDSDADAVYIKLSDKKVEETEKVNDRTIADIDGEGEVVGIELLDVSNRFSTISELNIDFADQGKATV